MVCEKYPHLEILYLPMSPILNKFVLFHQTAYSEQLGALL